MYHSIRKIESVIEELEAHMTEKIDCEALASKMALSVYEFRRIFSFLIGCSLSEYIRKRRLSLAACELVASPDSTVQEIGEKYGYSTPSAFSKAFSEYHGFSPSVCQKGNVSITLFPRPRMEWSIQNSEEQVFRIIDGEAFAICGHCGYSDFSDTCCCEDVWSEFYAQGKDKTLSGEEIYVSYRNDGGRVKCRMGDRVSPEEGTEDVIPPCRWLTVTMNTTEDGFVNRAYHAVLCDLLPSWGLKRRTDVPTVEVFPRNMEQEYFEWEIRIPIEKEQL